MDRMRGNRQGRHSSDDRHPTTTRKPIDRLQAVQGPYLIWSLRLTKDHAVTASRDEKPREALVP